MKIIKKVLITLIPCIGLGQVACSHTAPKLNQNIDNSSTLGSALAIPRELFGVKIGEDMNNYQYKEVNLDRKLKQINPPEPMNLLNNYYIDNSPDDNRITSIIGTAEFSSEQECLDKKWEILQKLEKKYDTVAQFATYLTSINDDSVTAKCLDMAKTTKSDNKTNNRANNKTDNYRLEVVYQSYLTLPNVAKLFGVKLYSTLEDLPKNQQQAKSYLVDYTVKEPQKEFQNYKLRIEFNTNKVIEIKGIEKHFNMQMCLQNMQNYRQQLETAYQMRMRKMNNGWQVATADKYSVATVMKLYCEDTADSSSMILSLEVADNQQ